MSYYTDFGTSDEAVSIRNACKSYGKGIDCKPVLNNLNMTVPKGTIYGLLGSSVCGKTTLLSCIVGRRRLDSGEICVLGGKPCTRGSGVPGKRVGYMPQQIALYGEFSIRETMMYFGWIFGMESKEINKRLQFLLGFLDLPSEERLVKNLSGGQQRHVSFAVALLHDPELLILDEPTVGADPFLRQSIWNHLVHITKAGEKTVIIATHNTEEARLAHMIGLMRSGNVLTEESPKVLMRMNKCTNLEEVFLKLYRNESEKEETAQVSFNYNYNTHIEFGSKKDEPSSSREDDVVGLNYYPKRSKEVLISNPNGSIYMPNPENYYPDTDIDSDICLITSKGKIKALLTKNFLRMWRNVPVMMFIFVLPVMQAILFCMAIGREPKGLNIAIYNGEMEVDGACFFQTDKCDTKQLGCRYLSYLSNFKRNYYMNWIEAKSAVRRGEAWGAIYISKDFSSSFVAKAALGRDADNATIDASIILVWLDMSHQPIGVILNRDLLLAYTNFVRRLLIVCEMNSKHGNDRIYFNEPIYGTMKPSFTDFVAPGVILTIVFFLAALLTSLALVIERNEGMLDRSWVAGVSPGETLFSHVITQFVVICVQTSLILIFMFHVFKLTHIGGMYWVVVITLLQGMCGMCFGFLISAFCELERNAFALVLCSFCLTLLMSGIIWPIEGIPIGLRLISSMLPLTLATSSLRSILNRGWTIVEPAVYNGLFSTLTWIVMFLMLTMIVLRGKQINTGQRKLRISFPY